MKKIHLQGMYGMQNAIEVKNLKVGDIVIWNFGFKSRVIEIVKETKSQRIVKLEPVDYNGKIHDRRMGKERLVAVA